MKKIFLAGCIAATSLLPAWAGGLMTNTNQHTAFNRMFARGASIDIDGVYSNPAGLAYMSDGFHVSLTIQSAFQNRDINAVSPLFKSQANPDGKEFFHGAATAPVIPSAQFAWKKNRLAVSAGFAVVGGGGKCKFESGIPQFSTAAIGLISQESMGMLTRDMYNINTAMEGRQYIYGITAGVSYKFHENFSAYVGLRGNISTGGYKGHLNVEVKDGVPEQLIKGLVAKGMSVEQATQTVTAMGKKLAENKINLDCNQSGGGVTPIIGVDAKIGNLNLSAKYEFITKITLKNSTKVLECPEAAKAMMAAYEDGVKTPADMPAMLAVSAGYQFIPNLRANVEFHYFDDKHAKMAGDKQKYLTSGTFEYLGGIEWDIIKYLTVSGGFQITRYGLSDDFQSDASFSCNSYSLGFGARVNITSKLSADLAYFWTTYKDYTKTTQFAPQVPVTSVYSRTNKVLGISLNYNF